MFCAVCALLAPALPFSAGAYAETPDRAAAEAVHAVEGLPALPLPPTRTVVPPRPDPSLPDYGVTWAPARPEKAEAVPWAIPEVAVETPAAYGVFPADEAAAREVSIRVVVTVDGKEHVIEIPQATVGEVVKALAPAAVLAMPAAPAPGPVPLTPARAAPAAAPQAGPARAAPAAAIVPGMPAPDGGGVYRVQVGSFTGTLLAQRCFDRLRSADFDPRFERYESERYGRVYRVVIPGVDAAEMRTVAQRLGNAGFRRALIRREN